MIREDMQGDDGRSPDKELRQALGEWIEGRAWDHYATLTTAKPVTRSRLFTMFRNRFVRKLEQLAQRRIDWLLVVEGDSARKHIHLHALLYSTARLRVPDIQHRWGLGRSRVEIYRPFGGAAPYMAKDLPENPWAWDFSRRLPPLRRNALGQSEAQ